MSQPSSAGLDQRPSLLRSRLAGELTISRFRLTLIPLVMIAVAAWGYLAPAGGYEPPPLALASQGLHVGVALVLYWFVRYRARTGLVGYVAPAVDVSLALLALVLYGGGPGSELRAPLARAFGPMLFVLFNLLSIARYNPGICIYTGALGLAANLALELLVNDPTARDLPGGFLGMLTIVASTLGAWKVALGGLRLAERTARTEEALELEQVYQLRLFESRPEAVVHLSPDGVVVRINPAFTRLFGYTAQEAVGRGIDGLIVPADLREEGARYSAYTARGNPLQAESVRTRKDGTHVDVSIVAVPVFHEGRHVAIFGAYADISERRRRERLFEGLNRAALRLLLAGTDDEAFGAVADELEALGLWCILYQVVGSAERLRLTHVRGDQALRERVERLLGRPLVGIEVPCPPGSPYRTILESREPILAPARYQTVLATVPGIGAQRVDQIREMLESVPSIGARLPGEGGAMGLLVAFGASLGSADATAVGTFAHQLSASLSKIALIRQLERNLEELELAQTQLLQAQKLEAVGRLAGGVAHDFNNLLTIITGYGEIVRESLSAGDRRREDVEEILRAASRASDVTRQLLAFSRRQVLRVERLDPVAVVEGMRNTLLRLIGEDITLVVEVSPGVPAVRADSTQMSQAILNITLNARDAMRDGGTLTVGIHPVEAGDELQTEHPEMVRGPYACIVVTDSGPGIKPEVLPHVFEPFFTTKEPGRGTGLGLAMVYGFVKQSGGYVYAQSGEAGGARFTIYLPAAAETSAGPETPSEPLALEGRGSECVMVVEDEAPVLLFTCTVLERSGYRVLALPGSAEALAVGDEVLAGVDLLVTDVVMPGLNGRAMARELEKRRPGLKVLYVSGYADDVFSRIGLPGGALSHLQKPYTPAELLRRVREALSQPAAV